MKQKNYDVIIFGGGISGILTAYWLQKHRLKIAIIEKNYPGWGASGRNAGFLTHGSPYYLHSLYQKHEESFPQIYQNFIVSMQLLKQIAGQYLFTQNGSTSFLLAKDKLDHEYLKDFLNKFKIPYSEKNNFQSMHQSNIKEIIHIPTEASLNPIYLLKSIMAQLDSVDFYFPYQQLNEFSLTESKIFIDQNELKSEKIVICLNGFTTNLIPEYQKRIFADRAQILSIQTNQAFCQGNFYYSPQKIYFQQNSEQKLVIGGMRTIDIETESTHLLGINQKIQQQLIMFLENLFDFNFNQFQIFQWSGILGNTIDSLPICERHPQYNNCYIIGGYNGHGIAMAPLLTKNLVHSILQGTKNSISFKEQLS